MTEELLKRTVRVAACAAVVVAALAAPTPAATRLRAALQTLPVDIDDHTPCRGAIRSQLSALEKPLTRSPR
jgi:hypothetical protein